MRSVNNFGSNLAFFRRLTGLTQEKMAEEMGMSHSYYVRLEKGHRAPGLKMLIKISNVLDIPIDFLLKDECNNEYKIYSASKFYQDMKSMSDDDIRFYTDTLFNIYTHLKEKDIDTE